IVLHASPKIRFDPIPAVCHESAPVVIAATEIWGLPGSGVFSGAGIIDPLAGVFDPSSVTEGDHLITYSFTTGFGCRADSSRWIHINPTPLSSFDHTHGCLPNAQIQFSSNSTVSGGTVDSLIHLWDFGDPLAGPGNANTSTVINPVHSYHSMDTFNVHLKTTSLRGCVHDTALKLYPGISIFPQPKAEFKIDSLKPICAGSPVYFINKGSGGGQAVTRYNWDFGDGNFSSATNPNHVYQESGIYSVSSWLQNEKGCLSDTALSSLIVHSVPKAGFSYGSTCIGQPVQFTDRSTNALGTITAWKWNLGNGNMETVQHPATTYTGFRPYMISLKVATANGCVSAIANKVVSIQPVNVFAGRDTAIAIGEPLQLIASGGTSYSWTPSTGLNDPNIYNPIAVLRNDHQTYFVKGVTSDGCLGFDTINIKVFTKAGIFLPNAFTPNGDGLNDQLQPICIGIKKLRYFQVFDRWGNLVFSSTNIFDIWNARLKGEPVPMGSYTWIAEALTFDDRLIQRKGSVLVIR
ncbi:MAG TPA: PKD domain-containing protein, partial [Ferruginibacter sp.]|nr:PKD domain-containing protein [Ferruginibacter sp.]